MKTIIYGLVDPQTKLCRYVGKTKGTAKGRLKAHISDSRRNNVVPRFRWIIKLAKNGLAPEVIELETVEDGMWQEAEQFWICYMRGLGSPLLNATDGGDGLHGFSHSEETKRKMSIAGYRTNADPVLRAVRGDGVRKAFSTPEAKARLSERLRMSHARPEVKAKLCASAKARASTSEFRERMSKAHKGKTVSLETRAKLSARRKGVPLRQDVVERIAAGHRGLKHSEETKAKMRETWARKRMERACGRIQN